MIFAVLKRWLLQQRETDGSFVHIIFEYSCYCTVRVISCQPTNSLHNSCLWRRNCQLLMTQLLSAFIHVYVAVSFRLRRFNTFLHVDGGGSGIRTATGIEFVLVIFCRLLLITSHIVM